MSEAAMKRDLESLRRKINKQCQRIRALETEAVRAAQMITALTEKLEGIKGASFYRWFAEDGLDNQDMESK